MRDHVGVQLQVSNLNNSRLDTCIINNGNRTVWSPIWSVIMRVINKIGRPRNYCAGLKSDSEIGQLAVIGYLKSDSYISQSY